MIVDSTTISQPNWEKLLGEMKAKVDVGKKLTQEERNLLTRMAAASSTDIRGDRTGSNDSAKSPESAGISQTGRDVLGDIIGKTTELGAKMKGFDIGISGGANLVGDVVEGAIRGRSPTSIAKRAGVKAGVNIAAEQLGKAGVPGYAIGPAISTGMKAIQGAPGYEVAAQGAKSLIGTAGAIAGQAIVPIPFVGAWIGSAVAEMFAGPQIASGGLGDILDTRGYEQTRDIVEDVGRDAGLGYFEREALGSDYAKAEHRGVISSDEAEDMARAGLDTKAERDEALADIDHSDMPSDLAEDYDFGGESESNGDSGDGYGGDGTGNEGSDVGDDEGW